MPAQKIDVSGKSNKTTGTAGSGSGGGYGGLGGSGLGGTQGPSYGTDAVEYMGSMGATGGTGATGGYGGGRVVVVSASLVVDGTIQANGDKGLSGVANTSGGGGGSGGGILLKSNNVTISNYISAAGGGGASAYVCTPLPATPGLNGTGGRGGDSPNCSGRTGGPGGSPGLAGSGGNTPASTSGGTNGNPGGASAGGSGVSTRQTTPVTDHFGGGGGGAGRISIQYGTFNSGMVYGNSHEETSASLSYAGSWGNDASASHSLAQAKQSASTYSPGTQITYTFSGRKAIKWFGHKTWDGGHAEVFINDILQSTVDLFSSSSVCINDDPKLGCLEYCYPVSYQQELFSKTDLDPATTYTFKVVQKNAKNAGSSGYKITFDYLSDLVGGYANGTGSAANKIGPYANYTNISPYYTTAALGSHTASSVGLRYDSGTDKKVKASTLTWNATTGASGQKLKYKVRGGNNQSEIDASSCYGPAGSGSCSDWTDENLFFWQKNVTGAVTSSGTNIYNTIPIKRYFEVLVRLEGDGSSTPTLNDVTLGYDYLNAPTTPKAFRSDGITEITTGTFTNETLVVLKSSIQPRPDSSALTPEVELVAYDDPTAPTFTGTPTTSGVSISQVTFNAGECGTPEGDGDCGNALSDRTVATVTGLDPTKVYYFKVRMTDAAGRRSEWSSTNGYFQIEQTAPTIGIYSVKSGTNNTDYVNGTEESRKLTASGVFNDAGGSSGTLQVQFSQDGTNWGKYSGSGTTNSSSSDWTNYLTVAAGAGSQDITNAWYLEGTDAVPTKTVYVRVRDGAGNVSSQMADTTLESGTSNNTSLTGSSVVLAGTPTSVVANEDGFFDPTWCELDKTGTTAGVFWNNTAEYSKNAYFRFDTSSVTAGQDGTLSLYVTSPSVVNLNVYQKLDYGTLDCNDDSGAPIRTLGTILAGQTGLRQFTIGNQYLLDEKNAGRQFAIFVEPSPYADTDAAIATSENGNSSWRPKLTIYAAPPYQTSGTFTSRALNSVQADPTYGNISWAAATPTGTTLTVKVRGADSEGALSGATLYDVTNGGVMPVQVQNMQYTQYQATLGTSDDTKTPALDDIFVELNSGTSDSITLDTTAPAVPAATDLAAGDDSGTPNDDNITKNTTNLTFTGTAEADSTVELFRAGNVSLGTAIASGGNYSFDIALAEGVHSITAKATDSAGNTSAASTPLSVTVDATGPTAPSNATITSGAGWNTNYIANANKAAVKVSGNKSTDTVQIKIEIDDEDTFTGAPNRTLTGLGGGSTFNDATGIDATSLAEGSTKYRITAYDAAGNEANTTNQTGAQLTIVSGNQDGEAGCSSYDDYFSDCPGGNYSNSNGFTAQATHPPSEQIGKSSSAFFKFDISTINPSATPKIKLYVTGGYGSFHVQQVIDYGNLGSDTTSIRGLGSYGAQAGWVEIDVLPAYIAAEKAAGRNFFAISVGTPGGESVAIVTSENPDTSKRPNLAVTTTGPQFTKDTIIATPSTPNLADADDSGSSNSDNITKNTNNLTLTGTAEANSTVVISEGGGSGTATGGNYSFELNTTAGAKSITVTSTDAAGNTATSAALSLNIDTSAPAAPSVPDLAAADDSGISNSDNKTSATTEITIGGTAELDSLVELFEGATSLGTSTASGGNWTIDNLSLLAGSHSLTANTADLAGNTSGSSAPLSLLIDTASPNDPANLHLTDRGTDYLAVAWDAASAPVSGIYTYKIQRKLASVDWSAPVEFTPGNVTTFTDTGLAGGTKYSYRLKVVSYTGAESAWFPSDEGSDFYTVDTTPPSLPTNIVATACDGTANNCSDIANEGFEMKLVWNASIDTASGTEHYKIYRKQGTDGTSVDEFEFVGVLLDSNLPGTRVYYDNDTNNLDATTWASFGKTSASDRLNDFTTYHYRIVAYDVEGNETEFLPLDIEYDPTGIRNHESGTTVDATPPETPLNLQLTALGVDANEAQKVRVEWTMPTPADPKAAGRTPEGNGSGVSYYSVTRADGDENGPTGPFVPVASGACNNPTSLSCEDQGLGERAYYYYKVQAVDNQDNESAITAQVGRQTLSSAVPFPSTTISVLTTKGDPADNDNVGRQATVTFSGAKIKWPANKITGYKIYRAAQNYGTDDEWFASGTLVGTISDLNVTGYTPPNQVGDIERTFVDNNIPADASTFYYKVRTVAYNPDTQPNVQESTLSAAASDIVPDATAPATPTNVQVKNLNPGQDYVRNVVTWQRISIPLRNNGNDFKEYRVYRRSQDEVNFSQLTLPGGVNPLYDPDKAKAIDTNYYVDAIPNNQANKLYYYYVTAVDDAGTNFKYPNQTAVNAFSNESEVIEGETQSVNPGQAYPTIQVLDNNKKSKITSVGVSSATVYWQTDQETDSVIAYRKAGTSDAFITSGTEGFSSTHSVNIRALEPNTSYEYKIKSRNHLQNETEATGSDLAELKTSDFSIGDIDVSTTTSTATITWKTNIDSDSYVEYIPKKLGNEEVASKVAGDSTLTKDHSVSLTGLRTNREYIYKVRSVTGDKYVAETGFLSFVTKADDLDKFLTSPAETNVSERNITATTAKITWVTRVATTSWVEYGVEAGLYSMTAGDNNFNTAHNIELQNLAPGTTYYYRVKGTDLNGIEYFSPESSFTAVLMPEISNLRVREVTPYTATITFDTNVDALVAINYGKDSNYGSRLSKAAAERNHVITLKELEDASTYHFNVQVLDQFQNEAKSADNSFNTPLDTIGPEVLDLKVDVLPISDSSEGASVIVSWTTDKPATTQVEFDAKPSGEEYELHSTMDETLNTSHTVIIKDLEPSTSYRFRVVSEDKRKNLTKTKANSFITPTKEKSLLQVIIKSFEDTFSWVSEVPSLFGRVRGRVLP